MATGRMESLVADGPVVFSVVGYRWGWMNGFLPFRKDAGVLPEGIRSAGRHEMAWDVSGRTEGLSWL
ncbi:MAG: hypothetical protein Q4C47_07705 [Planctomycetia bacterium]|nr:hypothetical protein [Planctomycetia bacterium]